MYNYDLYNVISIPFPDKGMNRNVSSEILPVNRTHTLENILPLPLGEGNVRFGTRLQHELAGLAEVIEMFGFVKSDGKKQLVIYGSRWEVLQSQSFETESVDISGAKMTLTLKNDVAKFADSPKLKIVYKNIGTHIAYPVIGKAQRNENVHTFNFENLVLPEENNELVSVSYQIGCLRVYDIEQNEIITSFDHLSANCIPRSVIYQNKLITCNGIDRMLVWDGHEIFVLSDYVAERNARPQINDQELTLENIKNESKYFSQGRIKLKIDEKWHGPYVIEKIENKTITITETLPELGKKNIVYYEDFPPAFSYLYVFQHRIWALSEGSVNQDFRKNPMRVYYTDRPGQYDGWFREETQHVPYIDIGYKHNEVDNLEAIHSMGEKLIFIGRNQTQVWINGEDLEPENYIWESTVNGGVIHGNLIIKLPNDLLFVSQNGIMQFSTLNVAKQFSIASVNAVDPLVRQYIDTLKFSSYKYRQCKSFVYHEGPFLGFKIGANPVLIGIFDTNVKSWSMFSGSFRNCTTLNSDLNELFMTVGNRLLSYGDGRTHLPKYSDDGLPVSFRWTLPVFRSIKQRFHNKRFELDLSYPSAFVTQDESYISLLVTGDLPREFTKGVQYEPVSKGDLLGTVKFALDDEDESDYLELGTKAKTIKKRLRFIAQKFWATVYGQSLDGPVKIKNINFFGSK